MAAFTLKTVLLIAWPEGQNLSVWPGLLIPLGWSVHILH